VRREPGPRDPDNLRFPRGVFHFEKGNAGFVEIGNKNTDGHVIIDAVQPRNGDGLPHAKRQRRKEEGGGEDVMSSGHETFGSPRECLCASTQLHSPTRSLASLRLCVSRFHFGI
jgi:hypothetical protein